MTKTIILHGLGQTADDWRAVANHIKTPIQIFNLFQSVDSNSKVTLENLYSDVKTELNRQEDSFYLCGLSLGGLLTLMYATRENNPHLKGIIVSGAIYKSIPKLINTIQNLVFNFLPQSQFTKIGLNKKQAISLMKSVDINLASSLNLIDKPTLVICGVKDKANLKSSKEIHQLITHSEFKLIDDGKHELNKDSPIELSELISDFIHS